MEVSGSFKTRQLYFKSVIIIIIIIIMGKFIVGGSSKMVRFVPSSHVSWLGTEEPR
jgi:hypothetical protein